MPPELHDHVIKDSYLLLNSTMSCIEKNNDDQLCGHNVKIAHTLPHLVLLVFPQQDSSPL